MLKIYCDFEFSAKPDHYDLVCVVNFLYGPINGITRYNLLKMEEREEAKKFYRGLPEDSVLVSYSIEAEVKALMSLFETKNLDDLPIKHFICLFTEHKLLANRNFKLTTGSVIDRAGEVTRRIFKSDFSESGEDKKYINLVNALYKFLGIHDKEHAGVKTQMRQLCILNNEATKANIKEIIKYCEDDAQYLHLLDEKIRSLLPWEATEERRRKRGYYIAVTAEASFNGYYFKREMFDNLKKNAGPVMRGLAISINQRFKKYPTFSIRCGKPVFHKDVVALYLVQDAPLETLKKFNKSKKTGKLSIKTETLEKLYHSVRYNLPEDDYLAWIYRFKKMNSSLSGLTSTVRSPDSDVKKFSNYIVGNKAFPDFNPFGSQTGRNQPKANSFLMAQPAWLRVLLDAPKGMCLVSIDCGKQEVYYLAVASGDSKLIQAYVSGDPYVSFGLDTGILKEDMRGRPIWDMMRHICKTTVLMIQYGAGSGGLANVLSLGLNKEIKKYEAQKWINAWHRNYPVASKYREDVYKQYLRNKRLILQDGWTMWSGNTNKRSIQNFPIQGGCAVALREAVMAARREGVRIVMTQHDSFMFYVRADPLDIEPIKTVVRAIHYGHRRALKYREGVKHLTLDINIYGKKVEKIKELDVDGELVSMIYKEEYRDDRAKDELEKYYKYLVGEVKD